MREVTPGEAQRRVHQGMHLAPRNTTRSAAHIAYSDGQLQHLVVVDIPHCHRHNAAHPISRIPCHSSDAYRDSRTKLTTTTVGKPDARRATWAGTAGVGVPGHEMNGPVKRTTVSMCVWGGGLHKQHIAGTTRVTASWKLKDWGTCIHNISQSVPVHIHYSNGTPGYSAGLWSPNTGRSHRCGV